MSCSKKCFEKGSEIGLKVKFVMQPEIDSEDRAELKKLKTCAWTLFLRTISRNSESLYSSSSQN